MRIEVRYPISEAKPTMPESEAIAMYGRPLYRYLPINREVKVDVKTDAPKQSNEELCLELTGLTPSEYQTKFGMAWNE